MNDLTGFSELTKIPEQLNPIYYNPATGSVYREARYVWSRGKMRPRNIPTGKPVTSITNQGYYYTSVNGRSIEVHRLIAFEFFNFPLPGGDLQKQVVDHIDGNKLNNKLTNLRIVTYRENILNGKIALSKKSKLPPNVVWEASTKRYSVKFSRGGKRYLVGLYRNLNDATTASQELNKMLALGIPVSEIKSPVFTTKSFIEAVDLSTPKD